MYNERGMMGCTSEMVQGTRGIRGYTTSRGVCGGSSSQYVKEATQYSKKLLSNTQVQPSRTQDQISLCTDKQCHSISSGSVYFIRKLYSMITAQ